ncbi:MAG: hypothetical protein K6G63_04450 [Eubacterium sp.]|nr:hypothetical protein [Eubacterium sp.]
MMSPREKEEETARETSELRQIKAMEQYNMNAQRVYFMMNSRTDFKC